MGFMGWCNVVIVYEFGANSLHSYCPMVNLFDIFFMYLQMKIFVEIIYSHDGGKVYDPLWGVSKLIKMFAPVTLLKPAFVRHITF